MNLFKLVNVIEKGMSTLNIEQNLCSRLISPKSTCQSCVANCPTNSITFKNNKIEVDDHCVECGLCTTVCPTSALSSQRPSLNQLVTTIIQMCGQNERVYLRCDKMQISDSEIAAVTVPCLGMIPREVWVTISSYCDNLSIYQSEKSCRDCEISMGEVVWRKELRAGEAMSGKQLSVTSTIQPSRQKTQFNNSRRAFFTRLVSEIKTTNKLALREELGGSGVQSYQEKLQENHMIKVKKEWTAVTNRIVERVTNESVLPNINKRNLFLAEIQKNEDLKKRKDCRLPTILPDCNFCGACTILCPTSALTLENGNGVTMINLEPAKCVDCHLCEEICFFQHIFLQDELNGKLLAKTIVLAVKRN
ncbi:4Fe-4S binding protein [Neobacillus novalis]|uniref:4Fe-4S binding protein n=1 Tax=Neobacillus novalis TaxID=220687 RepID=A0AA95MWW4_9BACI|nr:4Fe-4S binding protein [Neobacillus novalis]WHY88881.1 4Fe-4S binding protein [Neobacillus novalis]